MVDSKDVLKEGMTALHTSHCLATGEVMISAMGDHDGKARGKAQSTQILVVA